MNKKDQKTEVKIEKKPGCIIELEITSNASLVKEAEKLAIKEIKKNVSISGFRKGKAPNEMILKKYPEAVKDKLDKKIADLSFIEAHQSHKLPSISTGSKIVFKIKDFSDKGAEISYTYETEPEVPKIDPKKYEPKKEKKHTVTKKEVDEAIHQMRFFYAKFESVERPIKEGDYIIIDLDSIEQDKDQKVFSDTRFEVSKKGMADWMQELVIGATLGEVLEGVSKPDEDASEKEKEAFAPKKVKVTIKTIEEATLPTIDDEFSKKVGSKNVEEMEESIKKMLEKQVIENIEKEKRHDVDMFLLKNYDFDLPKSLLASEVESRKSAYINDPRYKSGYEKMTKEEKENFEKEIKKHADNAIRIFYLSKKIISDYEIKISDDDIKKEALNIMLQRSGGVKLPDPKNIPKDTYALALSKLVLSKAQDYILEHCEQT